MSDDGSSALGPHPAPGDVVGGYTIEAPVGMGGMAAVFRAVDAQGERVALKVLNPARVLPEDVKRFTREFRALAKMSHPNIVRVHQAGVHEGYPWIAMEYVDGTDLGTLIERWRLAPPTDRFARVEVLLRGLCKGLQYVHDLGLIHRDLKPGNVLVTREGTPKLTDFGVVKAGETSTTHHTQLTMAGRLVGTVAFMAPELITEEGIDRRADLYALGAVLYLLLTFRRPIEAKSVAGYLARHLTEVPRPAGEHDPAVPRRLEKIAQRLLHKDRAYRYPSAVSVLQALDRRDDDEPPPLRGRDDALARWTRLVASLHDGVGGALALVGAPGSGRTRMLSALLDQVDAGQVAVRRANGGRGSLAAQLTGQQDLSSLGPASRGKPTVIAVDDLERAGLAEIEALARLARDHLGIEADPFLLVFTTTLNASGFGGNLRRRPTAAELEVEGLLRGESTGVQCEVLELSPVDAKSVIAMLRDRGVAGPVTPALGRRLHEEYDGRPGPIVQQLDALREAGWFEEVGDTLKPVRSAEDFRTKDLPVPVAVEAELDRRLSELDGRCRLLVELLAVIDDVAPEALLERCGSGPTKVGDLDVSRALDLLVQQEILLRSTQDQQEVLRFAHPCAARVARRQMSPEDRRARHKAVAEALASWRRRASPLAIARHRELSGDVAAAWPLYVAAARRAARAGHHSEVLDIVARAEALAPQIVGLLPAAEVLEHGRALALLQGEALLSRGNWSEALPPLTRAVEVARTQGDGPGLGRCLSALGRAQLRRGRFGEARALLEEALTRFEPGAPESSSAMRALADIHLRLGQLADSERLWLSALDVAIAAASRDGEARARRGLAHVRGVEGRLQEASDLLDQAEELLGGEGDPRVRAAVLARSVEFDTGAGRYGAAMRRAEVLVELVRRREMSERLPETYALMAEALCAAGDRAEAEDAAQQAVIFAQAYGPATWEARLRAARVLAAVGTPEEAERALPTPEDVPHQRIDDPAAQLAAIRARLLAPSSPALALDLATWAMTREPPLMALRAARISLDAALALSVAGQPAHARNAVKRGLKALQGPGADGIRLELLLAMHAASPEDRVLLAAGQVARRIESALSPQLAASFTARPFVREALTRATDP